MPHVLVKSPLPPTKGEPGNPGHLLPRHLSHVDAHCDKWISAGDVAESRVRLLPIAELPTVDWPTSRRISMAQRITCDSNWQVASVPVMVWEPIAAQSDHGLIVRRRRGAAKTRHRRYEGLTRGCG